MKRRDFLKGSVTAITSISAPTIINYLGESSPPSDREFLDIRDGNFYMGGDEYMIKGTNYTTRDHRHVVFEEYDPEQIEKELEKASGLGINAGRVGINFCEATGLGPDAEPLSEISLENFDNFEDFLGIADSKGIKVMAMPIIRPWNAELKKKGNFDITREHLEGWVPEFKDDERILAWDLKNEPDRNFENIGKERSLSFFKEMSDKIKELDHKHTITIGWSDPELIKETDGLDGLLDLHSFHHYDFPHKLEGIYQGLREETDKPILLEEFGLPTLEESEIWPKSEEDQEEYYEDTFQILENLEGNGSMFWTLLDFPEDLRQEEGHKWLPDERWQFYMGVLRTDYSKKPSTHVVQQYYKWIL